MFDERYEADPKLARLSRFLDRIAEAHKQHLLTGDYTALGIAAQDALREYEAAE